MYKIELDVVKAFLCDGLSHREIQKRVLKKDAPVRGGGFLAMNILHRFGIRERHKNILKGNILDEALFSEKRNITAYLEAIEARKSHNLGSLGCDLKLSVSVTKKNTTDNKKWRVVNNDGPVKCKSCLGSGSLSGLSCKYCNGTGGPYTKSYYDYDEKQTHTYSTNLVCEHCYGTGKDNPCPTCYGKGKISEYMIGNKSSNEKSATQPKISRQPIDYTYIKSIDYDLANETMEVEFTNGIAYQYYHVPKKYFERLAASGSDGSDVFREQVDSAEIRSIGYDSKYQILHVGFHNKTFHLYFGIPENIFNNFITADSHILYLTETVKSAGFRYDPITNDTAGTDKIDAGRYNECGIECNTTELPAGYGQCIDRNLATALMMDQKYEEAYELLNKVEGKSHKTYSLLINAALFTFRYEEATDYFKEYSQYICNNGHHSEEFKEDYNNFKLAVSNLGVDELNLPKYPKGNYPQSKEEDSVYPESKLFNDSISDGTYEKALEYNELCLYSDSPEVKGYANFFIGESYFTLKNHDEAYKYYLAAARNVPTKALFYGYAVQALVRNGSNKIAEGASLTEIHSLMKYKIIDRFVLLRRAIDLDPDNPSWHRLLVILIMNHYAVNNLRNEELSRGIKQQAIKEYEIARRLIQQCPNSGQQEALEQLRNIYNFN